MSLLYYYILLQFLQFVTLLVLTRTPDKGIMGTMERRKRQAILLGRHPIGKDDVLHSIEPASTQCLRLKRELFKNRCRLRAWTPYPPKGYSLQASRNPCSSSSRTGIGTRTYPESV